MRVYLYVFPILMFAGSALAEIYDCKSEHHIKMYERKFLLVINNDRSNAIALINANMNQNDKWRVLYDQTTVNEKNKPYTTIHGEDTNKSRRDCDGVRPHSISLGLTCRYISD